jgi:uncharacterized protein
MRPFGAIVHLRQGTVNFRLVGWLMIGSVPSAFLGAYLLKVLGHTSTSEKHVETILGVALLLGAAAMVLRAYLDHRRGRARDASIAQIVVRPIPTVIIGVIGGVIVGLTSVGSGSLMIVLLLFLYPLLGASQLVGTDLAQAVPLTLAAALGSLLFGHIEFAVTGSIIIGSVPAVIVGAFFSSRAPDRWIRPAITFVIFASGLKYAGLGTDQLGWTLVGVLAGVFVVWCVTKRPWTTGTKATSEPAAP